ncbi:MAG: PP2C family protein-serine/threonine phosphatase [Kofleriaceae bacterium]
MQDLWSSASYEPHLLSLPFAVAPAAMLIVIAYAAVMRGAPALRGWLLAHFVSLLPYATVMMLSPSITSAAVAEKLFQMAAAFVPMAAASGTAFQLALIRKHRKYRWVIWFLIANAAVWIVIGGTSDAALSGVRRLEGFWFPDAGDWAWFALAHIALLSAGGFIALGRAAFTTKPSAERRQLRLILLANAVTYAGLIDAGLAFGLGVFPIGWVLSTIGCALVVRALIVDDLLRVRAVDTDAPLLVVHFAAAILLGWVVLVQVGPDTPWWMAASGMCLCFATVRLSVAVASLVSHGARGGEGPLERLLAQLVTRTRGMTEASEIAQLAIDITELGVGVRPTMMLASEEDWGWTSERGLRLADEKVPDPLLMSWLSEHHGALFIDDLVPVPGDLRGMLAAVFEQNHALALVPVGSDDELLGLLVVPPTRRPLRGRSLAYLERVADRLAEALLHARMARRAAVRAKLAREVELAGTVQAELLPDPGPLVLGDVTVIGSWTPATICAGDFWGVHPLGDGRVLITIGDVTGHGVASAMITAAAVGACDAFVSRYRERLDLGELTSVIDAVVRRVGGGELAMTYFAAILDPKRGTASYVSCGHTTPYLCRPRGNAVELQAMVARGNLLGIGIFAPPKVVQRELGPGDLVVCYTDGVVDAQDPAGRPFGDRKLQNMLRRLDRARLTPVSVHDLVFGGVAAHRAGRELADDETLVVAQIVPRASSHHGVA